MLVKIWTQMRSSYTKHQIIGFTLLPPQQRGILPLTKWTTQADEVDFPTVLYFFLDKKEANTRIIVSKLAASQFQKIYTTLQYLHMEGEFF